MQETLSAATEEKARIPRSVPYIIGNEFAERFSFYGMRSILAVFLVHQFFSHEDAITANAHSNTINHTFSTLVYATPLLGAILADWFFGKYRVILIGSLIYTIGHFLLSMFDTSLNGFTTGLIIIAFSAGAIKSCVSANVGDQFDHKNQHLMSSIYSWFYFSINAGSMVSLLLIPYIYDKFGAKWAFGVPGILMALATYIFFSGRKRYVRLPAAGKIFTSNPFSFRGRVRRTEYFFSILILGVILVILRATTPENPKQHLFLAITNIAFYAVILWLKIIQSAKRCHDINKSGWYQLIPFYGLWLLFKEGDTFENDYGGVPPTSGVNRNNFLFISIYSLFNIGKKQKGQSLLDVAKNKFDHEKVDGIKAVWRVMAVFAFIPIFWSLWDMNGAEWVLQSTKMDLSLGLFNMHILPSQIQFVNAVFLLLLIPVFNYGIYPLIEKLGIRLSSLRKIGAGLFITAFSFVIIALIQVKIDAGQHPSVWWQILAYVVLSAGEVLVSITGLEYAYTQSPPSMKSTMTAIWYATYSLGSFFNATVNNSIANNGFFRSFTGASYYWLFVGICLVFVVIFLLVSPFIKEKAYLADDVLAQGLNIQGNKTQEIHPDNPIV